jgi:hypothetical protein
MIDSDKNQTETSYQVEMRTRFGIYIDGRGEIEYDSEAVWHSTDHDGNVRLSHALSCATLKPVEKGDAQIV